MRIKNIFCKAIVFLFMLCIILPMVVIFLWSFTNNYFFPYILPKSFSLRGWGYVIQNISRVASSLKSSFIISFFTTFITVIISIPCARALAFYDFKAKKLVQYLVFSPVVVPYVAVSMGLNMEFMKLKIARTYFAVILVSIVPCIPYSVNMLKEVFLLVGEDYFKVARSLGAGDFYIFSKLTVPMIMPGIISASIMCFIVSFSEYFLVYLIGGGKIITFTMEMFPFVKSGERIMASVFSVIFVISALILLFFMQFILKNIYKDKLEGYKYI